MAKKVEEVLVAEAAVIEGTVIENPLVSGSTSTAVGAVASWEDELAKYATEAAEAEVLGGTFLSLQSGRLSISKNPVAGNKLDCIVLASCYENAIYPPGKFNPEKPVPPMCYAFGEDEDTMKPHPDVKKPLAASCAECQMNTWKDDGSGKECKNVRRLALLPADCINDPAKIITTEQIYMKLPVTSVKAWKKYVSAVAAEFKRPPFAVITTLSTEPDAKTQFKVTLTCKGVVPVGAITTALIAAHQASLKTIGFPYPEFTATPPTGTAAGSDKF